MEYYKNLDLKDIKYFCEIDQIEKVEVWNDIPEFEGVYQISNLLRIKSLERYTNQSGNRGLRKVSTRILKQQSYARTGHMSVNFNINGKHTHIGIHVIVARVHIPNPLNLPIVEHKNDDPTDNRISNLMWSTYSENMYHAFERNRKTPLKGEKNGYSKVTEQMVLDIRASDLLQKELGLKYGLTQSCISYIVRRITWKHI